MQKPSLGAILWNIVSMNVGWLSSVVGAAHGFPWIGPVVIAALVVIHLNIVPALRRELATLMAAALLGYVLDSTLVLAGIFTFPPTAQTGAPSTIWMVALWVNFATSLNLALYWLQRRYGLALAVGAIAAPFAYAGGLRLGGLIAPQGVWMLIGCVALEWAIATPLVMAGALHIGRWARQPLVADTTSEAI